MGATGVSEYSVQTAKSAIIALINKISKQENLAFSNPGQFVLEVMW
jgi:hypothetical protein